MGFEGSRVHFIVLNSRATRRQTDAAPSQRTRLAMKINATDKL